MAQAPVNFTYASSVYALQAAISAYSDEAYTTAKKLSGTGIVGDNPLINVDTETFVGQLRWFKPLNPTINIASLTNAANGTATTFGSEFLTYIKSVRTHGATKVNLSEVITKEDGLAKIGRDFAETRAQDEHNALLAVLRGVAISELLVGAASASTGYTGYTGLAGGTGLGGQTYTNDPADPKYGFYVDNGSALPIIAATAAIQGAARAEIFLGSIGQAWKDYEPEYAYLITTPQMMASLRSANLVDDEGVQEANVMFNTIFGGKFRLIQTRASLALGSTLLTKLNTGAGVDVTTTSNMSFIVLPGAIAQKPLNISVPTEIFRDGRAFNGGGSTDIWYRWGYVNHPAGYKWNGSESQFAADADYQQTNTSGTLADLSATTITAATQGVWVRKASTALSLGILPILHG
jgi:hypothetical protein